MSKLIKRKHMLYKTAVDYSVDENGNPINDYAVNHVLGCSHGCKYPCYAMNQALRWKQVRSYEDWCEPTLVENTTELLEKELASKKDVNRVHMCFTTDPFPYLAWDDFLANYRFADGGLSGHVVPVQWEIQDKTMAAAEIINKHGIPVTVLTKGLLPRFEFGEGGLLACRDREGHSKTWRSPHPDNYYGISLVSLSEPFRKEWEPNTAPYHERIEALRHLHDAGCKTWVSMEPYPALKWNMGDDTVSRPAHSLDDEHAGFMRILEKISFVDRIVFGRWNYNKNMPTDVDDPDKWYHLAAEVVRGFCAMRGIECVIKKGTE